MEDVLIISKDLAARIIGSLKQIRVSDYTSMDILVGCVSTLEAAYNGSKIEHREEVETFEGGEVNG